MALRSPAVDTVGYAAPPGSFTHIPVNEIRSRFLADNYIRLDGLWSPAFARDLAAEATAQQAFASAPSEGPTSRVAPGRASGRPAVMVAPGPVLLTLHDALVGFLRALSATVLVPSQATYTYYESDEEVRLHVDTPACDVTVLTDVLGGLGPLHLHPELTGWDTSQLVELEADPEWDRNSGIRVVHPRLGATIIRGRRLPHHRPATPVDGIHAIAALHYRTLF